MNITKTELPTRPFTVKKFKLVCEGKEYIVVEEQHSTTIESMSYNTGNQELITVNHMHYQKIPTDLEMIKEWNWEHDKVTKIDPLKVINVMPRMIREDFKPQPPTSYGSDYLPKDRLPRFTTFDDNNNTITGGSSTAVGSDALLKEPMDLGSDYNTFSSDSPILLQWIKNLFKKK